MKPNQKIIIAALSTLVIGLVLGGLIFGGGNASEKSAEHIHANEEKEAGEVQTWTCSMHPQIRKNEPGKCPICGMELIPLENEENGFLDPMVVSMSPTAMELAKVSTIRVGGTEAIKQIRLNGKVQTDERLVFSQSSHIPGRVEDLQINFTGEYVQKGQTIARIYSPDLVTAQEELFEAQSIKDTQPQLFQSAKEKLLNWKLSPDQIDQILKRGTPLENFAVQADVSGYVTKKNVNPGDYIRKGEAIYKIADLSRVWVLFDVYESEIPWIKKGDKVEFTVSSLPGELFQETIDYLDPVIDPKTRVAKARVVMPNKKLRLKPEMFVSGTLEAQLEQRTKKLSIPKSAVMWTGKRSVVYVKQNTSKGVGFKMREIVLGPALGDSFLVEKGLEEGEEIAVNGTFSIDAAAQLAGKPSMMSPEGGSAMTGHQHGTVQGKMEPEKKGTEQSISISSKAKSALGHLYTSYFQLQGSLVSDDFEEAKKAGVRLKESLGQVNMNLFSGQAHGQWMTYSSDLKDALQHVDQSGDLKELREIFKEVSDVFIQITRGFRNPMGDKMYVQFCPMANQNQGASWLSQKPEIHNPYFGQAMHDCGETTTTIP
ncbi:efflux RND transporter periplasmic adaptor subunit [Echinicola jeungdonensis]|uniref:Efflux RND transporter periplasmic adaptor subunit n=1 Tax=Echinicola jeungdonensis TaxID=709343 RepID=A0ABV5J8Z4_9BACT|nr:efflux RND transporter periplasmic adaptor subunit [Echinicola jeungdonensis]MDN3670194.1 efflux RND transporter periplasmic adaptor subunit [Echinicola jeungdonensis]